jgi:hypothetical protein
MNRGSLGANVCLLSLATVGPVLAVRVAGYREHLARRRDIAQRRYLSDERLLVHIRAFDVEIGEFMAGRASGGNCGLKAYA